jgi:hypothetical protein
MRVCCNHTPLLSDELVDPDDKDPSELIEEILSRAPEALDSYLVKQRVPGSTEGCVCVCVCAALSLSYSLSVSLSVLLSFFLSLSLSLCCSHSLSLSDLIPARTERVWFLEDEVGCAITQNDDPTATVTPFVCHTLSDMPFSVLWLRKPLDHGLCVCVCVCVCVSECVCVCVCVCVCE